MKKTLCVDLDETLIKIDVSKKIFISLVLKNPFRIFKLTYLLYNDRRRMKEILNSLYELDASNLPYNQEVIELIKEYKNEGQKVFLVSGSHVGHVEAVSKYLGLFDGHFGTDTVNLMGKKKKILLVETFGEKNFDYIGDNPIDDHVFRVCNLSYFVQSRYRPNPDINFERIFTV